MKWTERDYQKYREDVCNPSLSASCEGCLKTGDEIRECCWEMYYDSLDV